MFDARSMDDHASRTRDRLADRSDFDWEVVIGRIRLQQCMSRLEPRLRMFPFPFEVVCRTGVKWPRPRTLNLNK